jgi:hypothetical protein
MKDHSLMRVTAGEKCDIFEIIDTASAVETEKENTLFPTGFPAQIVMPTAFYEYFTVER